ncbi:MAG: HTH-type transcriptional regulatory protein [Gammaproteobacteria bacterium]|nr:MAG: HTH-type transcriptional regulatory protein [Gammaproteobacteria bacterium]TND02166.1 MAG: HTH-type transcriptional regulatory protein [Gammaproteobacteria bacterium]
MDFYTLSDKGIEEVLGQRIRALRLQKNVPQKGLADATRLSLNAIKALESGRGKLSTIIAVLRELGALDHLDNFIPENSISPILLAERQGKVRERASGGRLKEKAKDAAQW